MADSLSLCGFRMGNAQLKDIIHKVIKRREKKRRGEERKKKEKEKDRTGILQGRA